ncbi:DNA polymerase [Edaphobacter aggregans]|uniref:DNA polymerase n=1 Tax=Edaphobacter aggregans TaxID=570835 RepID=UPI00163B4251|nr:DNA polymerase [Edaphobacter aggregans]
MEAGLKIRSKCIDDLERSVQDLTKFSEFSALGKPLTDTRIGETAELKRALAEHVATHGISLSQNQVSSHSTGLDGLNAQNIENLPPGPMLEAIKENKFRVRLLEQYQRAAKFDGRLHSLIGFAAATGRTTSAWPTVQNVPRDPRFRDLFRARAGHLILSADYAAIELRIAAVLAERADLRLRVQEEPTNWWVALARAGMRSNQQLLCPPEPDAEKLDWYRAAIPAVSQAVLCSDIQMMISIFRRGLDPHMVTGIDMARRQGRIDCGANPVEWLAARDSQTQSELKAQLHEERQRAKAVNFGLLYGMGAGGLHRSGIATFGLTWSLEEAAQARHDWFELYPEFRIWHWWTNFERFRKVIPNACVLWNPYEARLVNPGRHGVKVYETSTLSGRPFAILNDLRRALNYQNQGTGADILALAIASLPEDVAAMLLMPVHDELVLEVPVNQATAVEQAVVDTMVRAADQLLSGQVPVEVETAVGETWKKT